MSKKALENNTKIIFISSSSHGQSKNRKLFISRNYHKAKNILKNVNKQ